MKQGPPVKIALEPVMLKRALAITVLMLGGCCLMTAPVFAGAACHSDNGGLKLSPGLCATVFADKLGHVRHMAVAPDGVLYVNTWSGAITTTTRRRPAAFSSR